MAGWRKVVGITAVGTVLLLAAAITATIGWRPFIGPKARTLTDRRFEPTPERMARGEYLANHVMGCTGCHSEADPSNHGLPTEGKLAAGQSFAADGMPWLIAPNLTPDPDTGAGNWTDDALARAIREGIGHDGRALFPMMPYQAFRRLPDEDLASVIVYLRSLTPVRLARPASQVPFPLSRLINAVPEPLTAPVPAPNLSTPEKRGEHLATIADCAGCHTPRDSQGSPLPNLFLAGGNPFVLPTGTVTPANLTTDPSGIPYYTEDVFLQVMHTGRVVARQLNDAMPWAYYGGMVDDDLKAIYAYLKTIPPAKHTVDNSLPPTDCQLCGTKHGGGERNAARGGG